MAKRKIILPVALVAVILVAVVAFAACAPSSYSVMSPALQDYYGDYGEYYNNIVKSGRVRYRDVESGLYGYLDASGNVAIPAKYSSATSFGDGFAVVRFGSAYSVIDEDGGVIAGGFTSRTWTPAGAIVGKDGMYGVYNKDGCVLPVEYNSITANYSNYIIERNGKYGLADLSGKVLIQPTYDDGYPLESTYDDYGDANGLTVFETDKDGSSTYVDKDGNMLLTDYCDKDGIFYAGYGMYLCADDDSIKLYEDDLTTLVAELPKGAMTNSEKMLDEDRIVMYEGEKHFIYNIRTGERTTVSYAGGWGYDNPLSDLDRVYDCVTIGDTVDIYSNGEVTMSYNQREFDGKFVCGYFRDYIYNSITNAITDLYTGEQLTLSREIVDVTAAEEGIFAVMNAEGKYGVCAKNGDMIGDFIYSSVTVMADGFIGERRLSGGGIVYEWCGFDGNVILRSADMQIYAN